MTEPLPEHSHIQSHTWPFKKTGVNFRRFILFYFITVLLWLYPGYPGLDSRSSRHAVWINAKLNTITRGSKNWQQAGFSDRDQVNHLNAAPHDPFPVFSLWTEVWIHMIHYCVVWLHRFWEFMCMQKYVFCVFPHAGACVCTQVRWGPQGQEMLQGSADGCRKPINLVCVFHDPSFS